MPMRTHLTPALAGERHVGHSLPGYENQRVAQPRQKVWPHGSATGCTSAQRGLYEAELGAAHLLGGGAAERLKTRGAAQVRGRRRYTLAVAGLGVQCAGAALAGQRGCHGCARERADRASEIGFAL